MDEADAKEAEMALDVRDARDPREDKLREQVEAVLAKTEAQSFFTAVMTDTYIEEGEGDERDSD